MMNKRLLTSLCALALAASQVANALATYDFYNITGNNAVDAANGTAQLRVDVIDLESGQVGFKFYHVGSVPMSITDVYFDDGTLLGIASISASTGVRFSQGASPPNLPGGNTVSPPFETTAGFLADSDAPAQPNGVNPAAEWLQIEFNLIDGKTYADTIAALDGPIGVGDDLRIGIHVQGFQGGGSESFINRVPDGGVTAALLGLGILGLGLVARRRA